MHLVPPLSQWTVGTTKDIDIGVYLTMTLSMIMTTNMAIKIHKLNAHSYAAASSDARDLKACGCEYGSGAVFYMDMWIEAHYIPLFKMLRDLGVIKGGGATNDSARYDCGAW